MFQLFDDLYVLAIGGCCVFSGRPQDIEVHLNESGIESPPNQTPIETLMKISSQSKDSNIETLVNNTLESLKYLSDDCGRLKPGFGAIGLTPKWIHLTDLWHLLMRSMLHSYVCRWKSQAIQTAFFAVTALLIALMFNPIIGKINKCFDHLLNPNTTCTEILEEDSRLIENIKFIYVNSVIMMFIPICATAITFPSYLNVFLREQRNGKDLYAKAASLKLYKNFKFR